MSETVDQGRRALLRGRLGQVHDPLRPPWARPEAAFAAACTGCGACVEACPEGILTWDEARRPRVDFTRGECTFCRACVESCPEPAFDPAAPRPWTLTARIGQGCLAHQGIYCESCRDPCEPRAVRFRPTLGGIPTPQIIQDRCTGCGACVGVCPADAITLQPCPEASHEPR